MGAPTQLLEIVWDHANETHGHSWAKLNNALHGALTVAIRCGMRFERDEFETIAMRFRIGYWGLIQGHMLAEGFYSLAAKVGNRSACLSFERWKARRPFFYPNEWHRARGARLAVGAGFFWGRHRVRVTSFSSDGAYLVACSYGRDPWGGVLDGTRRFRLTPADLRLAARKEGAKCEDELAENDE